MGRHYLKTALRRLWRHKGATLIKLFVLGLGFSCFLGAYGVADYFSHADSGFANAGRIYMVAQKVATPRVPQPPDMQLQTAAPLARYLAADFPELKTARLGAADVSRMTAGDRSVTGTLQGADLGFLRMFDLPFVSGGGPDALDRPRSIIIPKSVAMALFGREDVTGETILLRGRISVTVTGVIGDIPRPTIFDEPMLLTNMGVMDDLQAPLVTPGFRLSESDDWRFAAFSTFVMLPVSGAMTRARLTGELESFGSRHIPEASVANFRLIPLMRAAAARVDMAMLNNRSGMPFTTMLEVFGVVILVVACLNFSHLAAAEAVGQARETGLRKVLGANQRQLLMQGGVETLFIGLLALAIALGLFEALTATVNQPVDRGLRLPGTEHPGFWGGLAAAFVAATLLGSSYPAYILSRIRPIGALTLGRSLTGAPLMRALMIGAQFAVSGFLLAGTAVVYEQNRHVRDVGMGGTDDPMLVITTFLPAAGIQPDLFDERMLAGPGIKGLTRMNVMPFSIEGTGQTFAVSPDLASPGIVIDGQPVAYDYFSTLGVSMLAGRDFSEEHGDARPMIAYTKDMTPQALQSRIDARGAMRIILDRAAAKAFGWSPGAAVGKVIYQRLTYVSGGVVNIPYEITGVVAEAPLEIRHTGNGRHGFMINDRYTAIPVIRIEPGRQEEALAYVRQAWMEWAPDAPFSYTFLDDQFRDAFAYYRMASNVVLGLGILAVLIAAMGLIGMAGFIVRRRVHEIGVRKTLGARRSQVLRLLLWEFSKPVIIANIMAWPLVWLAAQAYLSIFASRITITPLPFIAGMLVTLLIAWLAVGGQAWRAARVKPARVLRYE
jgi:putative ABC transport system permease protein